MTNARDAIVANIAQSKKMRENFSNAVDKAVIGQLAVDVGGNVDGIGTAKAVFVPSTVAPNRLSVFVNGENPNVLSAFKKWESVLLAAEIEAKAEVNKKPGEMPITEFFVRTDKDPRSMVRALNLILAPERQVVVPEPQQVLVPRALAEHWQAQLAAGQAR